MTLPTGQISMSDIRTEAGLSGTVSLSNFKIRSYGSSCTGATSLSGFRGGPLLPVYPEIGISPASDQSTRAGGQSFGSSFPVLLHPTLATSSSTILVAFIYTFSGTNNVISPSDPGWQVITRDHNVGLFYKLGNASSQSSWGFSAGSNGYGYAVARFPTQANINSVSVQSADKYFSTASGASWTHSNSPSTDHRAWLYVNFGHSFSTIPTLSVGGSGSQANYFGGNQYINKSYSNADIFGNTSTRYMGIWAGSTYRCQDSDNTQQPPTSITWTAPSLSGLAAAGVWLGLS